MKRIACSGILLTLLALGGCASPPPTPLKSLTLSAAPAAATSTKKAALTYVSSNVDGTQVPPLVVSGNVLFSVPSDAIEPYLFNRQDQSDTVEALQANLLRLKVFDAVEFSSAPRLPDLKIMVVFDKTFYEARNQQYTLNVTLHIQAGKQRFRKEYLAQSNPQGSAFRALALGSEQAKAEAARLLLEQLLTDIRAFAADKA
ncbi:MAG TPA: hypothetical protein VLA16_05275 [Ideonella sp.]|nr:hypothetical protein [Ideonella sp.]